MLRRSLLALMATSLVLPATLSLAQEEPRRLTEEEIGEVLGISVRTVKREWNFARAWLLETMQA